MSSRDISPVCRVWLWPCSIKSTIDSLTEKLQSLGAEKSSKSFLVQCEHITIKSARPPPPTTSQSSSSSQSFSSREFYRLSFPSENFSTFIIAPKFVSCLIDGTNNSSALTAISASWQIRQSTRVEGSVWKYGDFEIRVGAVRQEKSNSPINYVCMEICYLPCYSLSFSVWNLLFDLASIIFVGQENFMSALNSFRPINSWPIFNDFQLSEQIFSTSHRALLYSFTMGLIKAGNQ